jgi:parallel beta-helix repeat protein
MWDCPNIQIIGFSIENGVHAIKCENSSPLIRNNILLNTHGDGVQAVGGSSPTITNNLIFNTAQSGIIFEASDGVFINNTVVNCGTNPPDENPISAIECRDFSSPLIKNNILISNSSYGVHVIDGTPDVSYNNVYDYHEAAYAGISSTGGEIEADPWFTNIGQNDYTLQIGSPCIDAGDPDPAFNDADGSRNDMGAFGGPDGISYAYGDGPPVVDLVSPNPQVVIAGDPVTIQVRVWDLLGTVSSVEAELQEADETSITTITLYDDGTHDDGAAGDSIYGNVWTTPINPAGYWVDVTAEDNNATSVTHNNMLRIVGASADIFYVDHSNNTGTEDGSMAFPFTTIQQPVDLAGSFDTIRVAEGTYFDPVNFHRRSFVVEGGYNNVAWERDIELYPTILDGNHSHVPVSIGGSSPIMDGFIIQNGWSDHQGGAGINIDGGDLILSNSIIQHNEGTGVDEWGAGGICMHSGNLEVINCQIIHNHSPGGAGGIRGADCNIHLVNTLLANNSGQMVMHFNTVTGDIINSTITGNQEGFGFFNDSPINVTNSIIWNNNHSYGNDLDHFTYTDIENDISGTGNINTNPYFVDEAVGDYRLQLGSPCIDAGDPDPMYNDPDGTRNDMGAFGGPGGELYTYEDGGPMIEVLTESPLHMPEGEEVVIQARIWDLLGSVTSAEVEIGNPDEPPFDFVTLYDDGAHNDEAPGDSIYGNTWITSVSGNPDIFMVHILATDDNAITRTLNNAIEINTYVPGCIYVDHSNATGTEDGTIDHPYLTIQQAVESAAFGDTIKVAEGTYVENVMVIDKKVVLIGGFENISWTYDPVSNVTIVDGSGVNTTITLDNSSSHLDGLTIQNGFKDQYGGGGIESHQGNPIIQFCIIQNNFVNGIDEGGGGGMNFYGGNPQIINCHIINNGSPEGAGGIRAGGCGFISIKNTLLANNTGDISIQFNDLEGEFINCTLFGNEGGGFGFWNANVAVINCIQWGNNMNNWGDFSQVSYTNWEGWTDGPENMDADPLFLDAASGDFNLSDASPLINRGTFDINDLGLPEYDLAGNPREFGGRIDMGAYENQNVSLPPVDLEVIHWSDPWNRCDMDATEPVTIWVRNIGLNMQDDYMLSYSNDGGATFTTEHVTIPILPSDTLVYTFTQDGDFSAFGDFDCFAAVSVAGDADAGNDTLNVLVSGRTDLSAGDYFAGFEWDDPNTGRWTSEELDENGQLWSIRSWIPRSGENSYAVWGPQMDDWLYSHCFYLESSKTYGVAFQYMKYFDRPGINLELKAGTDPAYGSMTMDLMELTDLDNQDYEYALAQLTVPATGVYYLGWHATNVSGEWNYLFLDDVEVFEMDDYDVRLTDPKVISDYFIVPINQVQPISFGASVINKGALDVTGVTIDMDVNGGVFSTSGSVASLASGEKAAIFGSDSYVPDAVGTYGTDFLASINEPETTLHDNAGYQEFYVSDSVYAKDGGNASYGVVSNTGGINGNSFEIFEADKLTSLSVFFNRGNEGEQFHFSVFESWSMLDTTVGAMIFVSDTFTFDPGMVGVWNTFEMGPDGVDLAVGDYLIAIHTLDDNDIVIGIDDTREGYTVNYNEQIQANLITAGPLMLRANFGGDCLPPADWTVNPAGFAFNGQVTAKVFVHDVPVESGYLAAFVGDECRSIPVEAGYFELGDHFVFEVICHSNAAAGEMLTFKYFDTQTCEILEPFAETVEFTADMTVGDAEIPFELHYPGEIPIDLSFVTGWNWFSVNVLNDDMSLANLLTCATDGDYLKNQTLSATYYDGYGWYGSLEDAGGLDPQSLYKIRAVDPCGVSYMGLPVDVTTTHINVVAGWNWIGYLPQCILPIAEALDSLMLEDGDYIKNQTQSATYYDGFGWYGALEELTPGDGYMLRKTSADWLVYPECPPALPAAQKVASDQKTGAGSSLNPHQFEYSGTVTARVLMDGELVGSRENLVLAFVDDQLRGVMGGLYFEPSKAFAYPLMVYSNVTEGETITFKYYDAENDRLYTCDEILVFEEDMVVASAIETFDLHVNSSTGLEDPFGIGTPSLEVYPNPFNDLLHIEYTIVERSKVRVTVYDMLGKVIEYLDERTLDPGSYTLDWNAETHPDGTYLLKLTTEDSSTMKKVILMR